jgi:hypothetical protein
MRDEVFYYESMGQPVGPCSLIEIRERIAAGTIRAETRVRRGAKGKWRTAGQLRGFDRVPRVARVVETAPVDQNPYEATAAPDERRSIATTGRLAAVGAVGIVAGIFLGVVIASRGDRREEADTSKKGGSETASREASIAPVIRLSRLLGLSRHDLAQKLLKLPGVEVITRRDRDWEKAVARQDVMQMFWALLERIAPDDAVGYVANDAMVILYPDADDLSRVDVVYSPNGETKTAATFTVFFANVYGELLPQSEGKETLDWLSRGIDKLLKSKSDDAGIIDTRVINDVRLDLGYSLEGAVVWVRFLRETPD